MCTVLIILLFLWLITIYLELVHQSEDTYRTRERELHTNFSLKNLISMVHSLNDYFFQEFFAKVDESSTTQFSWSYV